MNYGISGGKSDVSTAFSLMGDMLSQYWWVYLAFIAGMVIFTPLSLAIMQRVDRHTTRIDISVPAIVLAAFTVVFSLITTNEFANWWNSEATACYNDLSVPLSSCPQYDVISRIWEINTIIMQLIPLLLLGGALLFFERQRRENKIYRKAFPQQDTPETVASASDQY